MLPTLLALALTAAPSRPNFVVIFADDLGINDLGCYGRNEHRTPNLDRMASAGTRFTSAYCAQPICSPSRAALLTGQSPARLRLTTYLPGRKDNPSHKLLHPKIEQQLPAGVPTVADRLKAAGYATACVGKWHLGGGPKARGFDSVHPGRANTPPGGGEGSKGEADLTRAALGFIAANKDKPFFLYVPHNTPHIPLGADPKLVEKYAGCFNPTYAAMMHAMDESVGTILAALDEHKLAEKTLVLFLSDNGGLHVPELKDDPPTHNTPYRAGKGFLYEGGVRVPTIVRWPGVVPAGRVSDVPFVNTDVGPTLLDFAGLKPFDVADGATVAALWKGERYEPRPVYWHFPHYTNQGGRPAGAVREGKWKFIRHYENGAAELYDLQADPGEARDVSAANDGLVFRFGQQLAEWTRSVAAQNNTPNPQFDAAAHKAIYLDVDVSRAESLKFARDTKLWEWRKKVDAAGK